MLKDCKVSIERQSVVSGDFDYISKEYTTTKTNTVWLKLVAHKDDIDEVLDIVDNVLDGCLEKCPSAENNDDMVEYEDAFIKGKYDSKLIAKLKKALKKH